MSQLLVNFPRRQGNRQGRIMENLLCMEFPSRLRGNLPSLSLLVKEYSLVVYQEDLASSEINENVVTVVFDRYISSAYWMVKFDRLFRDTAVRYLAVYMELMSRSKNETEEEWSWGLNSSDVLYVDPTPRGEDEAFFVSLVVKDKSKNKEMAERNESSKVSPWVDGQVLLHALQDQIFALSLKLEMNISRISQGLPTEMEKGKGREGFFVRNQELVIGIFIAVIVILMLIFSLGCYCHQRSQANYPHHFTPRNTYFAGGGEEFMDLGQHLATDEECKHSEGMATFLHGQGHGEQQRGKANGKAKAPKNNMNGRQMRSFNPLQGGGRVNLNEPDTTEECDWATPAPANLNTLVQEEDMTRI
ncbi:unnamed protein product [Darwinula stevensoni]|uniref:Uncharacterized protein n=1 Tax=Darwinula stevensoni TaxID=69355 RepID=A0A7R8XA52_9CRUS|nr:unnamed protein product [Darwinula stevensoni]CAG0889643.1 unnamed protein product [Darwinula stevensoni]